MNIRKTFLKLTERTYPYGFEDALYCFLPAGTKQDADGNFYFQIGHSKTIFACHLDTACKAQVEVNHVFDLQWIRTDGTSILGADDKAGVTILLWMIHHNIPGTYYFFIGEEVGCIGSGAAAKRRNFFENYDRIISFDRRGNHSVITHQSSQRTCSDKFANELASQLNRQGLNLRPDNTGVYTDSAEFSDIISECTNISVGYQKEHTHQEAQDIVFLEQLCHAVLKVDFESLPVSRDPSKKEYKQYNWSGSYDYVNSSGGNYWRDTLGYDDQYDARNNDYSSRGRKRKRGRGRGRSEFEDSTLAYGYAYEQPDYYYKGGKKVYLDDRKLEKPATSKDHYVFVRDMYLQSEISKEEVEIIRRDFLSGSEEDKQFANYMLQLF